MLKNTTTYMMLVLMGTVIFFASCKKDPFSEKDALQAQKDLLAQKFNYDLAIANVNLQIQRASDSAKIVIQNLVNSGATALEKEKLNSALALKLAEYNYLLGQLRFQDSLSRVNNYIASVGGMKSYQIRVVDFGSKAPINNATVRVLTWGSSSFTSARTNSDGIAVFNNVIIDPKAVFYAVDENTGVTSAVTMRRREVIDNDPTMEVYRQTSSSPTQVITGRLTGRVDLTSNSTTQNLGAGRSVTATLTFNNNNGGLTASDVTWSFPAVTNTSGVYSITVPRGFTYTVTAPSSIVAVQRMFVNYFEGVDNQFTSVTRLDSASVSFSPAGSTFSPTIYGYYFKLPADSLTGKNIMLRDNASASFMSNVISRVTRDIRSADGTTVDTLANHFRFAISNMVINNGWERPGMDNFYNYKIRLDDNGVAVPDTLEVEFVNLAGNAVFDAFPTFVVTTNAAGKLSTIEPKRATPTSSVNAGSGGRFNLTRSFPTSTTATILANLANRPNYTPSGTNGFTVTVSPNASSAITVNFTYGTSSTYSIVK